MARTKDKATPTKPQTTGTAVANWQEELAAQAKAAVASEDTAASGGGKFFSMRAGVLQFDEVALPGNQIACIIVDSIMENVFYEEKFDPDAKTPPTCFAFGRDADTMGPPDEVDKHEEFTRQSDLCQNCIRNEWGSAETGRGKACSNRRRLAIIPVGTYKAVGRGGGYELELFDDPSTITSADVAYMKLPVMSVKGFAAYLKQVAEQFTRPLHAVATRIYLEPDPKSQFRVKFEMLEPLADDMVPAAIARHNGVKKEIDFPYIPRSDDDDAPKPQAKAGSKNKLSGKAKRR